MVANGIHGGAVKIGLGIVLPECFATGGVDRCHLMQGGNHIEHTIDHQWCALHIIDADGRVDFGQGIEIQFGID